MDCTLTIDRFRKILIIFISSFFFIGINAQVVLYLEIMKEEIPIKYYEGQMLSYQTTEYPKEWKSIQIERILDEEKLILYDGGMLKLNHISKVRRVRSWVKLIGYSLQTFGIAWISFGGVAHFTTDLFDFGMDTAIIGGTAIASGWLLRKLFNYKKYKIGKKNRLKILDLSWPEPRG